MLKHPAYQVMQGDRLCHEKIHRDELTHDSTDQVPRDSGLHGSRSPAGGAALKTQYFIPETLDDVMRIAYLMKGTKVLTLGPRPRALAIYACAVL